MVKQSGYQVQKKRIIGRTITNKKNEKGGVRQRYYSDKAMRASLLIYCVGLDKGGKGVYATCSTSTPDHSDEQFSSGNPRKIATIRNQGFPHPLGRTQNRGFHIYLLRRRFHKRHSKQGCPHPFGEEVRTRIPNQGASTPLAGKETQI